MRALLILVLAACGSSSPPAQPPAPAPGSAAPGSAAPPPTATPAPGSHEPGCTSKPSGWCAAPDGDPCGVHPDVASCKADARCGGMAYTGESFVACKRDDRGFGTNCPTVGCITLAK